MFHKILLYTLCMICIPLQVQNTASIEVPMEISFAYGFDYHPQWYTQVKPAIGFDWGKNFMESKWFGLQYSFGVEQRYYYDMVKRRVNGKNTLHKSANYIAVQPSLISCLIIFCLCFA